MSWAEGTACTSSRKRGALDSPQGPTGRGAARARPGEGGVAVRSLDLVLGAEEFKQDRNTQLVFLKSIPISVVRGWDSGEAGTQSGDGEGGS